VSYFLQGVRVACYAVSCISYLRSSCPSVDLSVCPSVTRCRHCVKTTQAKITKSSPTDSPRTLVVAIKSSSRNSKSSPLARTLNESRVGKNCKFSANKMPYLRSCARLDQSYYKTNRKSNTSFRFVPKSTSLDDSELPLCTVLHKTCVFRSPPGKSE